MIVKTLNILKSKVYGMTKCTLVALSLILSASFITSCKGGIFEDLEECNPTYELKFIFDMNMDFADAFATKVNSVEVYAFDANTDELIKTFTDSGDALSHKGYTMKLDLEPGDYKFIAWCGLENNDDHFVVSPQVTQIEDLEIRMARNHNLRGIATQDLDLHPLFHGQTTASLPLDNSNHVYEMSLIKDTNNVNISVQEINGKPLDPQRFDIKITANNGHLGYDNQVIDDEDIEYIPYRKVSGATTSNSTRADDGKNIVLAELATSRLIYNHNPQLDVIDAESGSTIYSIPLVKWSLMLKSEQYSYMGDQEYLDREDEFNIVLYVSSDENPDDIYLAVSIMINGWRVVINGDQELH